MATTSTRFQCCLCGTASSTDKSRKLLYGSSATDARETLQSICLEETGTSLNTLFAADAGRHYLCRVCERQVLRVRKGDTGKERKLVGALLLGHNIEGMTCKRKRAKASSSLDTCQIATGSSSTITAAKLPRIEEHSLSSDESQVSS